MLEHTSISIGTSSFHVAHADPKRMAENTSQALGALTKLIEVRADLHGMEEVARHSLLAETILMVPTLLVLLSFVLRRLCPRFSFGFNAFGFFVSEFIALLIIKNFLLFVGTLAETSTQPPIASNLTERLFQLRPYVKTD